ALGRRTGRNHRRGLASARLASDAARPMGALVRLPSLAARMARLYPGARVLRLAPRPGYRIPPDTRKAARVRGSRSTPRPRLLVWRADLASHRRAWTRVGCHVVARLSRCRWTLADGISPHGVAAPACAAGTIRFRLSPMRAAVLSGVGTE